MIRDTWGKITKWIEDICLLSTLSDWVGRIMVVILLIGLVIAARIIWTVVEFNYQVVNVDTGECTTLPAPPSLEKNVWRCLNCDDDMRNQFVSEYVFQNSQSKELRKFSKDKHIVTIMIAKDERCHE